MAPYLPVPTSYPRLDMRLINALISYHLQVTSTGVSMVSRYHLERELTVIPRHTGTQPPTGSFTFAEQLIHVCTSMYVYARTEPGSISPASPVTGRILGVDGTGLATIEIVWSTVLIG
jgi:hypothetical protein